MPQTNKFRNPFSGALVVFQDVSTRHDWLVRWVCEMTLRTLTDLWIRWGPRKTEDIGAANFLFVNGRCHLANFWPVTEGDSIKKKEEHNRPGSNPGTSPVLSYALIYHFLPYHYTITPIHPLNLYFNFNLAFDVVLSTTIQKRIISLIVMWLNPLNKLHLSFIMFGYQWIGIDR